MKDESVLVLTIGEVATRLAISRTGVERMIERGELQSLTRMDSCCSRTELIRFAQQGAPL